MHSSRTGESTAVRIQLDNLQVHVEERHAYEKRKRVFDVIFSSLGLLLLSPIYLVTAILIKLEDPSGPMIFRQTRVGKNGRMFQMYKFRSMVANAEELQQDMLKHNEIDGAMFKMKNDPRVTRIGRFIRRTSIDELPQLWNVVKGEMSLVGRGLRSREVETYTAYDEQRLLVIPGCTGLWQVSGRNSVGFDRMVELDLQYIKERSFWLDIKIILKTFNALGGKNAY